MGKSLLGRAAALLAPCLMSVLVVGACGGPAFTSGGDAGGAAGDAGGLDGKSAPDGAEAGGGGDTGTGADATADVVGDATSDVTLDVLEEPAPPACTGAFACVPAVPAGWTGPLEVYEGATAPPSCTTNYTEAFDAHDALDAPPATCGCSCDGSPTGCGAPKLSFYVSSLTDPCNGTACYSTTLSNGACVTVNDGTSCAGASTTASHVSAPAPLVTNGTCPPQPSTQIPPITWGTYARACASTVAIAASDCQAGSVCAPAAAAPYGATLCISQDGDVACPSTGYTTKRVLSGGASDSRGCSACTCGSPAGASCAGSIEAYASSDGSCSGGAVTYGLPATCYALNQPADLRVVVTPTAGTCTPSSVSPTGSAVATNPETVCCLP